MSQRVVQSLLTEAGQLAASILAMGALAYIPLSTAIHVSAIRDQQREYHDEVLRRLEELESKLTRRS